MYQMSHNSNYLPRSALPHFPFTRREREREGPKSIRSSCCKNYVILPHQRLTLLFYHIILQHPIDQVFYHSILYIKIIYYLLPIITINNNPHLQINRHSPQPPATPTDQPPPPPISTTATKKKKKKHRNTTQPQPLATPTDQPPTKPQITFHTIQTHEI